jgi:hypothetical protein
MRQSGLVRYLKGKKIPSMPMTVRNIHALGDHRVVVSKDGSLKLFTKEELAGKFKTILNSRQKLAMLKTMRQTSSGVSMKIGGNKKGVVKNYKTSAGAKNALTRHYGKV